MPEKKLSKIFWYSAASFRIISCYASIRQNKPFSINTFSTQVPILRQSQSLYETVRIIYFHHFSWSHKCILCKDTTTFELSLINSTVYMAFPMQPLLFTETVSNNSYETLEGNPISKHLNTSRTRTLTKRTR